jgi:oligopeptide transport system substrate-binding protein
METAPTRIAGLLCLLTLLLAGCGSSSSRPSGSADRHRSSLQWGIAGVADVPTLDPALASDPVSVSVASLVYGGLVRLNNRLQIEPDGASSWRISHDGTAYTFHIRPNLHFADGHLVTAQDFADALDRALGAEGSAGTASFYLGLITHHSSIHQGETSTVRGITVLNPSTLRITLARPAAHFLAELAFPASYVPDLGLLKQYGSSWTDHSAGFGPYQVRQWQHSRSLELRPNPHYYGGRPALKKIVLHFYQQPDDAVAAYRRGQLDLVSGFPPGATLPAHLSGLQRVPALALDYLAFNTSHAPLNRPGVRRAFAAVKTRSLVSESMGASAFPTESYLPPAFAAVSPSWQPATNGPASLARAGFPHARHFPTLTFVVLRDPQIYLLARELQQEWETTLGVTVVLRQLNPSNYTTVLNAHAFDLALIRWGADYPDPQDFLGTQLGSSADNVTGWAPVRYNDLILLADSYSPDDPRRLALFRQAADLAARELPLVPVDEPALVYLRRPSLRGVVLTPLNTVIGDWKRAGFLA